MATISNREEFLFIYDVTDANPNGDPMDENKPRIDEESGINIVTDVRLKRTIRDFLFNFKVHNGENGKDIFIREKIDDAGFVLDVKTRVKDFADKNDKLSQNFVIGKKISKNDTTHIISVFQKSILNQCIDTRLFGAVYPIEFSANILSDSKNALKSSIKLTGPIQFKMGKSLHKVDLANRSHSFVMSSKDEKRAGSLAPEYYLPYSLIAFYGVINENAAKDTGLSESDVTEFYEAMWEGTKNLISRSKMGHIPRLLVKVKHSTPHFFIGDLDKYVKLQSEKPDEKIRDISDVTIDLSALSDVLNKYEDNIASIDTVKGDRITTSGWNH